MGSWFLVLIGVQYVAAAGCLAYDGHPGLALAFLGYAIGNLGLYIDAR
jgi:hypothetical protein